MDGIEYLSFVPLLLFGIGITDLISSWKRVLSKNSRYLPYSLFTLLLIEIGVYNVFIYFHLVDDFPKDDYLQYLFNLIPAILYIMITSTFIPEPGDDTEEYFKKRMPIFFTLAALFISSHFFYTFIEPISVKIIRGIFIVLLLFSGFTRKIWLIYGIVILWFAMILVREYSRAIL